MIDRLARLNALRSGQTAQAVIDPDETPIVPDITPQLPSGRLQRLVAMTQGQTPPPAAEVPPSLQDTGTPERPDNITAQYDDMFDPNTGRDSVFIGANTPNPYNGIPLDKNVIRVDSATGTLYTTNKVKADQYRQNPLDETRASVLGYSQPKSDLMTSGAINNAQVVVVTDPNGKRLFEEATSDPNSVIDKYRKQGYKNIAVESPEQTQINRVLPADPQSGMSQAQQPPILPVTQTPAVQPGLTTFERLARDIKTIGQATKVIANQPYKEGEIPAIIKNVATRAFSPLAYLIPGVSRKELIAELDKEAEQFTGFGPALAPAAGETGSMALELKGFQEAFGLVSKGAQALGKIPVIEKVAEAANKMGGVRQFAKKFPRIFHTTKTALKDFAIGDVIGQGYGALKGVDEDKSGMDLFKQMQTEGVKAGAWAGAFSVAGSVDRALYIKNLRTEMLKRFDLDLQQKIANIPVKQGSAAIVRSLQGHKRNGLWYINNVVASVESDLINFAKGELYPNIRDKVVNISPEKAAVRFLKYGYETGRPMPQSPKELRTGLGVRKPTEVLAGEPTTRAGEVIRAITRPIETVKGIIKEAKGNIQPQSGEALTRQIKAETKANIKVAPITEVKRTAPTELNKGIIEPKIEATPVIEQKTAAPIQPTPKADLLTDQFPVTEVPVQSLQLSKDVPNFKEGANKDTGVIAGEELHGNYNRLGTAPILVWQRNNGDMEVITGRHRLDLAKRMGEKSIPAQIVKESEGFDKNMALTADAESNIRDGQGSIKDYAQYFRNTRTDEKTARERGLLSRSKGKAGFVIGKSAVDDVYARFLAGKLSESKTAAIATGAADNESAQLAAAAKADSLSPDELEQYSRILSRTQPSDKLKATQGNLFGFDDSALQEAEAVAKEVTKETNSVKDRILAVKGALKRPEIAKKMGLKFSDETHIRQEVSKLEDRLEVLKRVSATPELYQEMKRRAGLVNDTKVPAKPATDLLGNEVKDADNLTGKQKDFGFVVQPAPQKDIQFKPELLAKIKQLLNDDVGQSVKTKTSLKYHTAKDMLDTLKKADDNLFIEPLNEKLQDKEILSAFKEATEGKDMFEEKLTVTDEILDKIQNSYAGDKAPSMIKLYQQLGTSQEPNVQLQDAEELGRMYEKLKDGEVTQKKYDVFVQDLLDTPGHKKYIADAVSRYDKKYAYTHIVNADMAKQILPDYDPANIENERKYFGDAAEVAGKVYDKWLKDRKGKGNNIVLFMAGGTGSGKSTVANDLSRKVNHAIIVDSTLTSKDYAVDQIDKALENGYNVAIRYIYREPVDAWENGIWTRWLDEKGHFIPADVFVNTHLKARNNLIELAEKYGDKIQIEIDENQSGQNVKQISIDELKAKAYDAEQIRNKINEISRRQLEKHGIKETKGFFVSGTNTSDSVRGTEQKEPRIQGETGQQGQVEEQSQTSPSGGSSIGDPALGNAIDSGRISVSLEPGNKPMPARDIVDYVSRAFNIPMRGKATHHKKALGWFAPKAVGIRMVDVRQLTTAMHEIGHHIDWTLNKRMSLNPPSTAIADELMAMGRALYGSRTPEGGYKSEGWAEFIRTYLTGEDTSKLAPALHKWFMEEYLPNHADISGKLDTVKGMIDKWRLQGAESRIDSQISTKKITGTLGERLERGMLWTDTMFRNEAAPLRTGMKKAGIKEGDLAPDENPYQIYVARADKTGAISQQFVLEYTTDTSGNRTGKGLREILRPVRRDIPAFTRWIVAARARLLLSREINPGISQMDADYVYNKYDSELWRETLKEITDWNHRVLDYLIEAGGMNQESADRIKKLNPIYIPFMRAFKEGELHSLGGSGQGIAKTGKAIKSIKGSGREIIDPLESMIKQTEKIIGTAHKAEVAKALVELADRPGMASLIWEVPAPMQATKFEAEQLKKDIARIAYERMGLNPEQISSGMLKHWDEELTVFSNASHYYGKDNIVSLFVDDKQRFYEVNPALYRALEGLDQYHLPWVFDFVLGKPARLVRLGATGLNASFGLIRNFIRDAWTFTVQAKHAKLGLLTAAGGVVKDIINTKGAQKFKAMGGKMSTQILADRRAAQSLKKHALASTVASKTIYTVAHPIDALRELFGITETGTRIGEFDAALKFAEKKWGKGSKSAAIYALNQAQDVTTNFSRHGKLAKVLNQIIPFFNAAIQGPDKMVRTLRERPISTLLKAIFALTLPAIWCWWKYKDRDWYKNMPEYERCNYLHFEIPGTDTVIRLPVPFELGYIFQSAPVAALDAQYRKDPQVVNDMLKEAVRQSNPFAWPATISPIIDILKNENFAGVPIVSKSVEYKMPEDQYNKHTTELMKIIGHYIGESPAKIEHLVNSYSGGLYTRVSRTVDLKDEDITLENAPVISTLILKDKDIPKAQLDKFYTRRKLLNQKAASKKIYGSEKSERKRLNKMPKKLTKQRRNN